METFMALRNYAKGKITDDELEDSDKIIYTIDHYGKDPGGSRVVIGYRDKEILTDLDIISDDDLWFYNAVNNSYSSYEFADYYNVKEDFLDGHGVYRRLDKSNIQKMEKISKYIYHKKINFTDGEYDKLSEFSNLLISKFKDEVESIIRSYTYCYNEAMEIAARDFMDNEISAFFKNNSDFKYEDGYNYNKITITVNNLIVLYLTTGLLHYDIRKLLTHYFNDKKGVGGWADNMYEFDYTEHFPDESFNRDVGWELDKIIDTLEDPNSEEYLEMIDRVNAKFNTGIWYKLPKDENVEFKINGFVGFVNKISISLRKNYITKSLDLSEENFNNLLYQPALFDMSEIY